MKYINETLKKLKEEIKYTNKGSQENENLQLQIEFGRIKESARKGEENWVGGGWQSS